MTIRAKVARAICISNSGECSNCDGAVQHFQGLHPDGSKHERDRPCPYGEEATAAITAFLEAAAAEGWRMCRDEATEEMLRAWVATQIDGTSGKDPDEMVPIPGTGQGDLQFYEFWRDVAGTISLGARIKAALAAAPEFKLDQ